MPQVEIRYSSDLSDIHLAELFNKIEQEINLIDDSAGLCKSRAYMSDQFRHSHIFVEILVMNKPHRDQAFMEKLQQKLSQLIIPYVPKNCHYSIKLDFLGQYYLTGLKL